MNEKYYYFAKLSEIRNIATRGLFCQWDEKENMCLLRFYVGDDGILEHKIDGQPDDELCLSLQLEDIEANIYGADGYCKQNIEPEKISVVTVKNLVNDRISNYWMDHVEKIELEKQKKVTPLLVEETNMHDYIEENPELKINKFAQELGLEKRKQENFITRMFSKIREKIFEMKQARIENRINQSLREDKKVREERLIKMAKKILSNKEGDVQKI